MALRSDDKIAVIRTTGGDKAEYFTLEDVNTFINSEEDGRLTSLEQDMVAAQDELLTMPTTIVVIDVEDADADDALDLVSKTYIVEKLEGKVEETTTQYNLLLPAATGSGTTIRVSNKRSEALTITADGSETIDADAVISLAQFEYATLVDYAAGKWARF